MQHYFTDSDFKAVDYSNSALIAQEYDLCTFTNCQFHQADLSKTVFTDCTFIDCDLSMAIIRKTAFRKVHFDHCKLLGLRFDDCDTFVIAFTFDHCLLNFSSFSQLKLPNILFSNSQLNEVEFLETDLTKASFNNCNLERTVFERAILKEADFSTSYNIVIDPDNNQLRGAKFSSLNVVGLLDKYGISIID